MLLPSSLTGASHQETCLNWPGFILDVGSYSGPDLGIVRVCV